MSTDQAFNLKLADAQLTALETLQAIITESAAPSASDPARTKSMVQLINIRLRGALALLRLKPRKIQAEITAKPREVAPDLTIAAIEAALAFAEQHPTIPSASPGPGTSQVRALLQRAGTPQNVPRREQEKAA